MLEIRFDAADLAEVRFAISPLVELMRSIRVLDDPAAHALHLPWIEQARAGARELPLDLLRALQPPDVYSPDFVHPPPTRPIVELEDELAAMKATPPAQVRDEIERAYRRRALPAVLWPFTSDTRAAVASLADLLREYWARTLAEHWPRIRAVLEGDVLHRARQMADGGARRLFADVDPTISWAAGVLRVDKPFHEAVDPRGRGLVLVPSVFVWPRVVAVTDPRWQPTLIYPARGAGLLWEPSAVRAPDALASLLGRVRAAVLAALDQPRSTTDLAAAVGVTPGGASQHLTVLRDAGLVHGHRVGRRVLYLRTPVADALLGGPERR
jgi:Family of unknown function (DUF5937)/Helix-turn-helix domain